MAASYASHINCIKVANWASWYWFVFEKALRTKDKAKKGDVTHALTAISVF